MQLPANLSAAKLRLEDGETVLAVQPVLRRKGIFGNRYGELYVTDRRIAFMKAGMGALGKLGGKPMLSFERSSSSSEKQPHKAQWMVVVTSGSQSERFLTDEPAATSLVDAARA